MTIVAVSTLLAGLLIFLISLPLVYRKVPMNRFYGIRIPASFESAERWYAINAYGGRQMALWSWLITVTGALGFLVPREHFLTYAWINVGVTVLAVLIPVVRVYRWSNGQRHE